MSAEQPPDQPTEEELRAAYEAELKRLRVEDVILQTLVSLVNLGGRRAGLAPGTEDEADPQQLRMAIDGARALLPLVQEALGPDAAQIRNALSQLQIAYAQATGTSAEESPPAPEEPKAPPAGGRLWVPGQ